MMPQNELSEIKYSILDLRQNLDGLYAFIDQAEKSMNEMEQVILRTERVTDSVISFRESIRKMQSNLETMIQPVDDAVTVMQRELTHLENLGEKGLVHQPDITVRSVSSLLQLSLSIAMQMFSIENLELLRKRNKAVELDTLRQRWDEWLNELTHYQAKVLNLVQTIAETNSIGAMNKDFIQSIDNLARQCRQWQVFFSKQMTGNNWPAQIESPEE